MRPTFLILGLLLATPASADLGDWLRDKLKTTGAKPDAQASAGAIKDALRQGTERAVGELGRENGFALHPQYRIPMPEQLVRVDKTLRKLGRSKDVDAFLLSLNRAAEAAAPQAREVFVDTVRGMTINDAVNIVRGGEYAGTRYFRDHTHAELVRRFTPIVRDATDRVGATRNFKQLLVRAGPVARLAGVSDFDLDAYVTARALDALFALIGEEEKRIRRDPVARTTELLKQVFGKN
ncbi:MAG: DUF4197 domain-containing protein [Pseudomonadota bacterium]